MRIAVVAPSRMLPLEVPPLVIDFARARYGDTVEIAFHPQCHFSWGHFAGTDKAREDALVEVANDPKVDAVWLAAGGYGANRIATDAIRRFGRPARDKVFMGYSDIGFLLAGLLKNKVGRPVHGPMPSSIQSVGGDAPVGRALDWLVASQATTHDWYFGSLPADVTRKAAAFNLTVFASLIGTDLQPDLTGRVLMLEEVGEAMYRIDRSLYQVTSNSNVRKCAGLMLGRCAPITPNDIDFGMDEEAAAIHWCKESGIRWLGRADIGHDIYNAVVPFG